MQPPFHYFSDGRSLLEIHQGTLPECPEVDSSPNRRFLWDICQSCWHSTPEERRLMQDVTRILGDFSAHIHAKLTTSSSDQLVIVNDSPNNDFQDTEQRPVNSPDIIEPGRDGVPAVRSVKRYTFDVSDHLKRELTYQFQVSDLHDLSESHLWEKQTSHHSRHIRSEPTTPS